MKRVAVVGAGGQLGAAIVEEFTGAFEVSALHRAALDLGDLGAVVAEMRRIQPAVIVNCAAYNAVDEAQDHPIDAFETNALVVRTLARAARDVGAGLVHYSSDFVFDGEGSRPYTEDDPPNPRSVYAASKLVGEWFALDAEPAWVLRVESLFDRAEHGPPSKGSVPAILRALVEGPPPKVFEDRTVTPTSVVDAARATRRLVEIGAPAGVYHCVNSGVCTWVEFTREAARLLGVEPRFEAVRMADLKLKASRPLYCALSNQKLRDAGVNMPTWQESLARYINGPYRRSR